MSDENRNGPSDGRDMLYLMGGIGLICLGAGLVLSHPAVRKAVAAGASSVLPELQGKLLPNFGSVGEDIQRYLKLKSM